MSGLWLAAALVWGYLAGSIPFSQIVAQRTAGADLRETGTGTVSGTGVYRVAGFRPVAVAGLLDIAKGAVAVAPFAAVGPDAASVLAGGAAVAGHNWSLFLRGAGGRGISQALGATLVLAPWGTVVLGLGLAIGRLLRRTSLGSFVSQAALTPVLAATNGRPGALLGALLVAPMWVKRVLGNHPPGPPVARVVANRLLFDEDPERQDLPEDDR